MRNAILPEMLRDTQRPPGAAGQPISLMIGLRLNPMAQSLPTVVSFKCEAGPDVSRESSF